MTSHDLIAWRAQLGLNQVQAAKALGIARNSLRFYEAGARPIPFTVALACAALSEGLKPIGGEEVAASTDAPASPIRERFPQAPPGTGRL